MKQTALIKYFLSATQTHAGKIELLNRIYKVMLMTLNNLDLFSDVIELLSGFHPCCPTSCRTDCQVLQYPQYTVLSHGTHAPHPLLRPSSCAIRTKPSLTHELFSRTPHTSDKIYISFYHTVRYHIVPLVMCQSANLP